MVYGFKVTYNVKRPRMCTRLMYSSDSVQLNDRGLVIPASSFPFKIPGTLWVTISLHNVNKLRHLSGFYIFIRNTKSIILPSSSSKYPEKRKKNKMKH